MVNGANCNNSLAFKAGVGDEEDGVFGELRWFHTASQGHLPNAVLAESFFAPTYDLTDNGTFFP
jgi:hypothetical protein